MRAGARAVGLLALCVTQPARAWGPEGHEIVADIAERHIVPRTRSELAKLLGTGTTLADVANYADAFRNRCANTGPWHYVNIPLDAPDYDPALHCPPDKGCVLSVLQREIGVLKDRAQPDAERAFAVRLIVHFVGDLHQPLHSADNRDRGGNDLKLRFRGQTTNLHRLWDDELMQATARTRASSARSGFGAAAPQVKALQQGTPLTWALEARDVARRLVYGRLPAKRGAAIEVGGDYVREVSEALDLQLLRAGARLAMVLDDAFARPGPRVAADVLAQRLLCEPKQRESRRAKR